MGPRGRGRWIPEDRSPSQRPTYVRFVCFRLVRGQRQRLGLFQALQLARESEVAADWALAQLEAVNDWFGDNLDVPPIYRRGDRHSLSWFKDSAQEHIEQMHLLKIALEHCGVHVEVLTTRAPGSIVYEDDHQIAAFPAGTRF